MADRHIFIGIGTLDHFTAYDLNLRDVKPADFIVHFFDHVFTEGAPQVLERTREMAEREVTTRGEVGNDWLILIGEDGNIKIYLQEWGLGPPKLIQVVPIEENRQRRQAGDRTIVSYMPDDMIDLGKRAGIGSFINQRGGR